MRKTVIIIAIILVFAIAYFLLAKSNEIEMPKENNGFSITSPAFQEKTYVPAKYSCDGKNILPPLSISKMPAESKSLILIIDDPDAPRGAWTHLLVWNISPKTTEIKEGEIPPGTIGRNSSGEFRYDGPCPPNGTHRYFFKVYALDTILNLDKNSGADELNKAVFGHILAEANLIGLYKRVFR